ncbi:MAG: hypothetical protein OEV44_01785 [Spirochaetota bacterium]|nr:hypothetical protein [Spirochaetota bacterium]
MSIKKLLFVNLLIISTFVISCTDKTISEPLNEMHHLKEFSYYTDLRKWKSIKLPNFAELIVGNHSIF